MRVSTSGGTHLLLSELISLRSIAEYVTKEGAERAISELTQKSLMGRPVFVREVR